MSPNFGRIDFAHLQFPAKMRIDYIRVYQRADHINIGCDPPDFPTAAYINQLVMLFIPQNVFVADLTLPKVWRGIHQCQFDNVEYSIRTAVSEK
jgi:hypothetical protein